MKRTEDDIDMHMNELARVVEIWQSNGLFDFWEKCCAFMVIHFACMNINTRVLFSIRMICAI